MPSNLEAQAAATHHRAAAACDGEAARHRAERDRIIVRLRNTDPGQWTHLALARAVGCSPELVAAVLRRSATPGRSPR